MRSLTQGVTLITSVASCDAKKTKKKNSENECENHKSESECESGCHNKIEIKSENQQKISKNQYKKS